ncbi:MAG TPA: TROVE domain-containing protein [Gemmatimonadaceae bacterium]|nr:TROVE domain-containing protein [Gemmatimonadaceae bacterium]
MIDFTQHVATRLRRLVTPQREPLPGTAQVSNDAGGYVWAVDAWARLDRFLVLGSTGGTYYAGERPLTRDNAAAVAACLTEDGPRVVRRVIEMSLSGRAPGNDPALFVLAMAASADDAATRAAALGALNVVARTGMHLFHWLEYVTAFRGWGRGVRRAVARWYTAKRPADLAYQVLKYRARDGWSHRDALRLGHPKAPSDTHHVLFRYALGMRDEGREQEQRADPDVMGRIAAVRSIRGMSPEQAAAVIRIYRLTREMVPTELLRHRAVWAALMDRMPLAALIRNLGVMTAVGLIAPGSDAARAVAVRLGDRDAVRRARVHPVAVLSALAAYASGRGVKGRRTWTPVGEMVDALDAAFYLAFENVRPCGKRMLVALDVSSSMASGVLGLPHVSCREAAAAMSLVTAASEPECRFVAFTTGTYPSRWRATHGTAWDVGLTELTLSPRQRLDDVLRATSGLPFGGTDCSVPMLVALSHRWAVDAFVVFTDNETWAGDVHPAHALRRYREQLGIAAKLVVVAMTSTGFSIADPDDAGMLDVVGFDAATPQVVSDFVGEA